MPGITNRFLCSSFFGKLFGFFLIVFTVTFFFWRVLNSTFEDSYHIKTTQIFNTTKSLRPPKKIIYRLDSHWKCRAEKKDSHIGDQEQFETDSDFSRHCEIFNFCVIPSRSFDINNPNTPTFTLEIIENNATFAPLKNFNPVLLKKRDLPVQNTSVVFANVFFGDNAYHFLIDYVYRLFITLTEFDIPRSDWPNLDIFCTDFFFHHDPLNPFPSFKKARYLEKRTCFSHGIIGYSEKYYINPYYANQVFRHPQLPTKYIETHLSFRKYMLESHGIFNVDDRVDDEVRILYVHRPKPHRMVENIQEVESYLEKLEKIGMNVTRATFSHSQGFDAQMRIAVENNVLIGPHGAGITHSIWLPLEKSIVIEFLPLARPDIMHHQKYFSQLRADLNQTDTIRIMSETAYPNDGIHVNIKKLHEEFSRALYQSPYHQKFPSVKKMGTISLG